MTSHDISLLATRLLFHITSPPSTEFHLTSQPTTRHHIPHRRTLHHHHRRTTETQPTSTKTPPPDGTFEGWCTQRTRFGHCTGWSPGAHSIGRFFVWFKYIYIYIHIYVSCALRKGLCETDKSVSCPQH